MDTPSLGMRQTSVGFGSHVYRNEYHMRRWLAQDIHPIRPVEEGKHHSLMTFSSPQEYLPSPQAHPPAFPLVSRSGSFVQKSILQLIKDTVETKDLSGIGPLFREEKQYIADTIHEMLKSNKSLCSSSSHDSSFSTMTKETRDGLRKLLLRLCSRFGVVPEALILKGSITSGRDSIAGGGFTDVFKGTYQQTPVAIRRPRIFQVSDNSARERTRKAFYKEALIWHQLDHPHILPLLGIIEDPSGFTISMVLPWMENGNVRQYLDKKVKEVRFQARYTLTIIQWLIEIMQGLGYLHSEGIVHGDLRGPNILVDRTGRMKLADFGLALVVDATQSLTGTRGSFGWLAPELFDPELFGLSHAQPTFASDVYSFACVCVELFSRESPFKGTREAQIMRKVCRGERPSLHAIPPIPPLCDLINDCWEQNRAKRPSADDVERRLQSLALVA
ncbi:hypothetical protein NLI96_g4829 [Meripilus lineatus]|uniref:Protein kinase domain-containing protein n=1 Tax=Meripilus lineatus TaxID=2056292 RepID=A0AAD5V3V2_9APHY|nr:hypothetical protein NLI96_g4829 [Physisporinus lineatus]